MGKTYDEIDRGLADFIAAQHLFVVATAPSGAGGHVNASPKGLDGFRILDPRTVAYLDLTGSGIETIAHLRDNGRITILFNAFEGPPRILRLYGRGEVLEAGTPSFAALRDRWPDIPGARAIVRVELDRIADSCGYSVPQYRYVGERRTLIDWAEKKGSDGLRDYRAERNAESIDGLPGLTGTSRGE